MKKKISVFVLIGFTAALLAGCGGTKSGDVTDASDGAFVEGASSANDAGSSSGY